MRIHVNSHETNIDETRVETRQHRHTQTHATHSQSQLNSIMSVHTGNQIDRQTYTRTHTHKNAQRLTETRSEWKRVKSFAKRANHDSVCVRPANSSNVSIHVKSVVKLEKKMQNFTILYLVMTTISLHSPTPLHTYGKVHRYARKCLCARMHTTQQHQLERVAMTSVSFFLCT